MSKHPPTICLYLLLAAACARTPVELGYGTDSDALSSPSGRAGAGGAPGGSDACECTDTYLDCLESGELAMFCRGELISCEAERPDPTSCSAGPGTAGTGGGPTMQPDPCEARYQACLESGAAGELCRENLVACSDALAGVDPSGVPAMGNAGAGGAPAMEGEACGLRYQECLQTGTDELCGELYRNCSLAAAGLDPSGVPAMGNAGAGGGPAMQPDPCEARYQVCLESGAAPELCRENLVACSDALAGLDPSGVPVMSSGGAGGAPADLDPSGVPVMSSGGAGGAPAEMNGGEPAMGNAGVGGVGGGPAY
jgi:hypothetical protein